MSVRLADSKKYVKSLKIEERIPIYEEMNIYNIGYDDYQKWSNVRGVIDSSDIIEIFRLKEIVGEQVNNSLKELDSDELQKIGLHIDTVNWFVKYNDILCRYKSVSNKLIYDKYIVDLAISVSPFIFCIKESLIEIQKKAINIIITDDVIKELVLCSANNLISLMIKTMVLLYINHEIQKLKNYFLK